VATPSVTTVTTTHGPAKNQVSTARQVQDQRSDGVILALLGLGSVLGLTAISGGRFAFTGPGGIRAEIATVAEAGQLIGKVSERHSDDPEVQVALARWQGTIDELKRR
jgi:hypothetical protein